MLPIGWLIASLKKFYYRLRYYLLKIDSKELTEYINSIKNAIESASEGSFQITSDIEFELAIINSKEKGGSIKLYVVDAKGKFEDQAISKIKFTMGYKVRPTGRAIGSMPNRKYDGL